MPQIKLYPIIATFLSCMAFDNGYAQQRDSTLNLTLDQCLQFAYQHNPTLQQSLLDKQITEQGIHSRLADWFPQINFDYNIQHSFQLQTSNIGGNLIQLGVRNTSAGQFSATQNIFNSDALLASSTAKTVRKQADQNITSTKIDLAVNVGKAFYDVLLTKEQLKVLDENITRLDRSLTDAYNQYEGGIVDKVDYKRATIALNNTKAQRKTANDVLKAKFSYLKMQMGVNDSVQLNLSYDSSRLAVIAVMDTTGAMRVQNRIEYQLLKTQQSLQHANYNYYKWKFLPTVQAFGNYNLNYLNNEFSNLYRDNYPNSFAGVRVSVPLFQGFRRVANMKQAKLQLKRVDFDLENLGNSVSAEYSQALATYRGYLNDYYSLKENVTIAADVYETIELQYKAGIKTYLEVITAQTDLRTAELNYTNALYQLLGSKLDVERALGSINPN
ncbi:TolC family protein [Taibaiella chishuiensis]|uniref:Outer membrane protein TolC n=1 Tax=Taibaiella chishuiensis TaxID=1434707 RepID=A0A2P8D499_9BACT|nr:TolC family protein [Taibaiella chishuiensis]PSK92036.1 outer membrane protein TolC [Taibaiella chishuiensis]